MFQITHFSSAKNSKVQGTYSLDSILKTIKYGDEKLRLISAARHIGKGNYGYDEIKKELLPTYRFNFLFSETAKNENIISPTGLIYLDADNISSLPQSEYILAYWKSLSNTGFSILAKVSGLTLENYKDTYNHVSELIGINSDPDARKASQQTIQSFDSDLYHNPHALVYICPEEKKVSPAAIKKKEKCIETNETFYNNTSGHIRFNNINDYFIHEYADIDYRIFKDKILICNPYIPLRIDEGKRNSRLFFLLSQYSLLNPKVDYRWLKAISDTINRKMYPNLSNNEINSVIDSVLKQRKKGLLVLYLNQEKRVLFNPRALLSHKQKMDIVNKELGKLKSDVTREIIYLVLEDWNFEVDGKITQKKVAHFSNRGESTIKKYWGEFKKYVKDLNQTFYSSNVKSNIN